jgi:hypothetical protein
MPLSLQRKKGVCRRGILSMAVACPKKQRVAMSAEQIEWERMRTSTLLLNTAHKSSWLQCKKGVCRRGNNQWLLLVQESNVLSCLQSKQSGSG